MKLFLRIINCIQKNLGEGMKNDNFQSCLLKTCSNLTDCADFQQPPCDRGSHPIHFLGLGSGGPVLPNKGERNKFLGSLVTIKKFFLATTIVNYPSFDPRETKK